MTHQLMTQGVATPEISKQSDTLTFQPLKFSCNYPQICSKALCFNFFKCPPASSPFSLTFSYLRVFRELRKSYKSRIGLWDNIYATLFPFLCREEVTLVSRN